VVRGREGVDRPVVDDLHRPSNLARGEEERKGEGIRVETTNRTILTPRGLIDPPPERREEEGEEDETSEVFSLYRSMVTSKTALQR
jgi:hypothetical protein